MFRFLQDPDAHRAAWDLLKVNIVLIVAWKKGSLGRLELYTKVFCFLGCRWGSSPGRVWR